MLVDQGKYEASWEAAASVFRQQRSVEEWRATLAGIPLVPVPGTHRTRVIRRSAQTTPPPGAPDGTYFEVEWEVAQVNADREVTQLGVETVTVVEEAGAWRVASYSAREPE